MLYCWEFDLSFCPQHIITHQSVYHTNKPCRPGLSTSATCATCYAVEHLLGVVPTQDEWSRRDFDDYNSYEFDDDDWSNDDYDDWERGYDNHPAIDEEETYSPWSDGWDPSDEFYEFEHTDPLEQDPWNRELFKSSRVPMKKARGRPEAKGRRAMNAGPEQARFLKRAAAKWLRRQWKRNGEDAPTKVPYFGWNF
jgi:hypothetical protein